MSWILRWRGEPASYTDEELAMVEEWIRQAETREMLPSQAAAEWDVLHTLKVQLDARPVPPVNNPGCPTPQRCAVNGCITLCHHNDIPMGGGEDLFFPVESIEELEAGRLRRDA